MEIDHIESGLLLTDSELAQALSITPEKLLAWRAGVEPPTKVQTEKMAVLEDMAKLVREAYPTDEGVQLWMNAESRYLFANLPKSPLNNDEHWMTPREALRAGYLLHARGAIVVRMEGVFL